jgi:hypothetical protein
MSTMTIFCTTLSFPRHQTDLWEVIKHLYKYVWITVTTLMTMNHAYDLEHINYKNDFKENKKHESMFE